MLIYSGTYDMCDRKINLCLKLLNFTLFSGEFASIIYFMI